MSTMTRHLHVLLDEDRWHRLEDEATRRQVSVAAVVRDAIDDALPSDLDQRRAAWAALRAVEPVPVPDNPADLKRAIDEARGRGL
jgi:hypothetical protein